MVKKLGLTMQYPEGYLEAQQANGKSSSGEDEEEEKKTKKRGKKRKSSGKEGNLCWLRRGVVTVQILRVEQSPRASPNSLAISWSRSNVGPSRLTSATRRLGMTSWLL